MMEEEDVFEYTSGLSRVFNPRGDLFRFVFGCHVKLIFLIVKHFFFFFFFCSFFLFFSRFSSISFFLLSLDSSFYSPLVC